MWFTVHHENQNPKKINGVIFRALDVTDTQSINDCIQSILAEQQKIDILINNAGVGITGAMEEVPLTEAKSHFDTNFFGPLNVINTVLPTMRTTKSRFNNQHYLYCRSHGFAISRDVFGFKKCFGQSYRGLSHGVETIQHQNG